MATIGEISEKVLSIGATCNHSDTDFDFTSYVADPGWIIYDIRMHEITDNGRKTYKYEYKDRDNRVVSYEAFLKLLSDKSMGFLEEIMRHPKFKDVFDKLERALDNGWVNIFRVGCSCFTDMVHTADIRRDYYVKSMYIGDPEGVRNAISEWLNEIEIQKEYKFSNCKDLLEYRSKFHLIIDNHILVHEPLIGYSSPSVLLNLPRFPDGTKIFFKTKLATEYSKRKIELVIWNMEGKPEPEPLVQKGELIISNNKQYYDFDLTHTLQFPVATRAEIYWHDNDLDNLLIMLDETSVVFKMIFL